MARILAVGMLPPPVGGQALLFQEATEHLALTHDVDVIDIQLQSNLGDSGVMGAGKVLGLLKILLFRVLPLLFGRAHDILYYCPSGPSRFGVMKDILILPILRAKTSRTVFRYHATGGPQYALDHGGLLRRLGLWVYDRPDVAIRLAEGLTPDDPSVINALEVRIVPNGIEDPVAVHGCRWTPPRDKVRLCYIGAITEGKGVFVIVDAVKMLLDRGIDIEAILIGEGNEREVADLKTKIELFGLRDRVVLAGLMFGRDKFEALANSTLFCFPSFFGSETQPLAVTEAIALGVPVVATAWRAIPSIVQDGVSGFLVEPGRSDAVADAIERLITSSHMQAFSESGRAHFLRTFTKARFLEALEAAITQ